jgi:hypothetical protein
MKPGWRIVLALPAVLAVACSSVVAPYQQYEIQFDAPAMPPLGTNPSDRELIDSIAWLMRHRLDLPFPPDIKAYVYVNQATFVDGLLKIGGEKADDVRDRGRSAFGVATGSGLFLRGDYLARMNLAGRSSLFAHELAHVSQSRLREGGRGRPAQWILEGHAEWVKFKVVDLLGYRAYAESRDIMMRAALGSTIKFFPDLPALATNAAWIEATRRLGALATYGQAFLAVDWLVEQYGSAKLLEFLGRFALDTDPREHWRTIFPIAYRQFADEFRARLEGLGRPTPPAGADSPAASPPSSSR